MRLKLKAVLIAVLLVTALACITGCAARIDQYEVNDADNYTVSVKYDANGGMFAENADTSIIVDSYNISDMEVADGNVQIALIAPDDMARGKNDACEVSKAGYFLAGWYAVRNETSETDKNGNTVYTYEEKWDFEEDLLSVAADGDYSSKEPVLTLYAAWVPMFEIEFCSMDTGEVLETLEYNPMEADDIMIPAWSMETGKVEMNDFPERSGYTFDGAYYDAEGKEPLEGESVIHTAKLDYETATASDTDMKIYIDWLEGEHYRIYTAEQFVDNAAVGGIYEIMADLDFAEETWPTLYMQGKFTGSIIGNGYTMKNIDIVLNNNSKTSYGLFGRISDGAHINDVTFENVSFTIQKGAKNAGTCYGLFAGTISEDAEIAGVSIDGTILIDSGCYFATEDYSIGLVCGLGDHSVVDSADIKCSATGANPESVRITVDGNTVTLEFITE